jgi:hypothetical protein
MGHVTFLSFRTTQFAFFASLGCIAGAFAVCGDSRHGHADGDQQLVGEAVRSGVVVVRTVQVLKRVQDDGGVRDDAGGM